MVESLYVNVGETLDVKLKVDQYQMINCDDDPCIEHHNYSANEVRSTPQLSHNPI